MYHIMRILTKAENRVSFLLAIFKRKLLFFNHLSQSIANLSDLHKQLFSKIFQPFHDNFDLHCKEIVQLLFVKLFNCSIVSVDKF